MQNKSLRVEGAACIDTSSSYPSPNISGPHSGVLLTGAKFSSRSREGGIYGRDGRPLPNSDIVSGELTTTPASCAHIPSDLRRIDAPVLFAGLATEQFGHVLLNSVGRLWALDHLPNDMRLLFVPKRNAKRKNFPHLRPVLDSLGIRNEFILSKGPMAFDDLHLATDLFGERYNGHGTPAFFDWLEQKWPVAGPVEHGRKIYVTRSRLGPGVGRAAAEEHLEKLLVAQGYEIFAPEKCDLRAQVDVYRSAEHLIFAEGSAMHLYAMVRRPKQKAVIIKRRQSLPELIESQMAARPGEEIRVIHALKDLYWPPLRSDHLSVALLDFAKLREELVAAGMIGPDAQWSAPTRAEERRSLNAGLEPGQQMLDRGQRQVFLSAIRSGADWSSAQAAAQGETKLGPPAA